MLFDYLVISPIQTICNYTLHFLWELCQIPNGLNHLEAVRPQAMTKKKCGKKISLAAAVHSIQEQSI